MKLSERLAYFWKDSTEPEETQVHPIDKATQEKVDRFDRWTEQVTYGTLVVIAVMLIVGWWMTR